MVSNLENKHVQHSKKLAVWSLIQWAVIVFCVLGVMVFSYVEEQDAEVLMEIISWSATLAAIVVSGYMGNSSVEKYVSKKFRQITPAKDEENTGNG